MKNRTDIPADHDYELDFDPRCIVAVVRMNRGERVNLNAVLDEIDRTAPEPSPVEVLTVEQFLARHPDDE